MNVVLKNNMWNIYYVSHKFLVSMTDVELPCRNTVNKSLSSLLLLIYRVSDAAARAKWPHSLIHKASVQKSVRLFSIF